jgi:hypothetical protein
MARIPESCAPVNAQVLLESQLSEALEGLCRTIGARLTALLEAIVSYVVGRGENAH